jgi:hypothetical protein
VPEVRQVSGSVESDDAQPARAAVGVPEAGVPEAGVPEAGVPEAEVPEAEVPEDSQVSQADERAGRVEPDDAQPAPVAEVFEPSEVPEATDVGGRVQPDHVPPAAEAVPEVPQGFGGAHRARRREAERAEPTHAAVGTGTQPRTAAYIGRHRKGRLWNRPAGRAGSGSEPADPDRQDNSA